MLAATPMAALVPLDRARFRPRCRRGISAASDTGEQLEGCITVAKRRPSISGKTSTKRKSRATRHTPQLMEEIVMDILVRLPVKSLMRFKSVCKAWQAIISDPSFIRAHLRHSAAKWDRSPCFIISPHTLDRVIPEEHWPSNFSNHLRFYQWQLQCGKSPKNNVATILHAKDFGHEFNSLRYFTHCDGLVFAPTDTRLYVFNPATRETITLPDGYRNFLPVGGRGCCYCAGLGLDPRTGKYKVVQAFYRSMDPDTNTWTNMGMEVFTIAGDDGEDWREIIDDPPYPVKRFQTALTINGFLFWRIAKCEERPHGILYLSLEEEEFGITGLPDSLDPSLDDAFILDVLYARDLCVTACTSETTLTIWTLPVADQGLNSLWEWRYSIEVLSPCHTMSLPPFSNGIILWQADTIYCYDLATSELTTICELHRMRYQRAHKWKNLFTFNVKPFTESLIQITKA